MLPEAMVTIRPFTELEISHLTEPLKDFNHAKQIAFDENKDYRSLADAWHGIHHCPSRFSSNTF